MIAFSELLTEPAKQAGIPIPDDVKNFENYKDSHPHFFLFCIMQLGQPMPYPSAHWDNACVIAEIPEKDIATLTITQILNLGFNIGYSSL